MEGRKCCDEDILGKMGRALVREEERRWREKTSKIARMGEKDVGEWTEQCVACKHTNIDGTS